MPRSYEALDKLTEDEYSAEQQQQQNQQSSPNSLSTPRAARLGSSSSNNRPPIAGGTSSNPQFSAAPNGNAPLLFSPPGGRSNNEANLNAAAASYFAAPPAYSHTTQVPAAGTHRDSLLFPANDSLLAPNPDNVSYSSSEAEVNSSQIFSKKRRGAKGRASQLGDGNPHPAEELTDTPNVSSSATPNHSTRAHSTPYSAARGAQQQQQHTNNNSSNNAANGTTGTEPPLFGTSLPSAAGRSGAGGTSPQLMSAQPNNTSFGSTSLGLSVGDASYRKFKDDSQQRQSPINGPRAGNNYGYSEPGSPTNNRGPTLSPRNADRRGGGGGGGSFAHNANSNNNLSRQGSSLVPNASMAGAGGGSQRGSTRYSRRGESNLDGTMRGGGGGGGGGDYSGAGGPNVSPRISFVDTIKDVGEQFVDIVRNKSKRHLRSHDELTMSPFQKFIHYGRFPCKLVLSVMIVVLITVLIFTFELPNSLNDENERQQLIDLFMDAIDVEGASGRREPGEDYTFVPKLFLSTQESVLEAMANVGQLYYNITRESLCDLDFFFNDEYTDFPRNVTVPDDFASSSFSFGAAAADSSATTTTRRTALTLMDGSQEEEGEGGGEEGKPKKNYAADRLERNRKNHPKLRNIVKAESTASDLPEHMRPEHILSSMLTAKYDKRRSDRGRARNRNGRLPTHRGGAPTLDEMGERAARRRNSAEARRYLAADGSNAFGRFFNKGNNNGDGNSGGASSSPSGVTPPPPPMGSDGVRKQRIYFPAMRSPDASTHHTASTASSSSDAYRPVFVGASNTEVGMGATRYFSSYYDYVRFLFTSGQIDDPFFVNSTWVQPPTLSVKFMRASPRVDWAAADEPTRLESYAVTLDNLLGPFILAPDADDGSSEPGPADVLPIWSYHICAAREDPLFEGHYFLPCRDSIDQDGNETVEALRRGEKVRLTSKRRLPGSPSSLSARRQFSGASSGGSAGSASTSVAGRRSSKRMARRAKRAAKHFKALSDASGGTSDNVVLSSDAAKGGKKSLQNALATRKQSSGRRGFRGAAIDGDADRLFTPFGIFDTTDDAVVDMYIHQLFTASNSKNPQFSDLFYQDSIYVWHVRVYFDLDTNGLATVTVEVDNQVRRNHSSFQTIFFLLILLLVFAVWDAVLRVRGLRSVLHLKRMIRRRLESLRREQVRRAWAKAREQEENAFASGGVQKLFAAKAGASGDGTKRSASGGGSAFGSQDNMALGGGADSVNNLTAQLLGTAPDDTQRHEAENRNAQEARCGGLLTAPGGRTGGTGGAGYVSPTVPSSGDDECGGEKVGLLVSDGGEKEVKRDNIYADAASNAGSHFSTRPSSFRTRFVRGWKDMFGIDDSSSTRKGLRSAASASAAARGPANPAAFTHPITQKVLTDHELQQLERKCRKSLKSDAGMSWQILAIVCDILSALYVCFAVAQATSLTVSSSAVRMERIILGVAGLFSSVLLVSYLRFFPKFYFMIRATSAALPRVILFYIGVLPIFFAFSIFWVTVFGSFSKGQFDSLTRSIATLYCCMFGDNLLPTFQAAMNNDSYEIYFLGAFVTFAFIAFFMFAVLNLTMSIVMDSFDTVKEKYGLQVDDPSQQYLQYGSKGVMAMKAAEQKQIEAVRNIREQLGVIAKTLPIINGGKSKRAERRNKAKDKAKQRQQQRQQQNQQQGGSNDNTANNSFNHVAAYASGGRNNTFEADGSPPQLSISTGETQRQFREEGGRLAPPTSGDSPQQQQQQQQSGGGGPPRNRSGTSAAARATPTQRSPALTHNDEDDYNDDDFEDDDERGMGGAFDESEATKATRARFESKYHEFMMEPGLDGDVLSHLGVHYDERDENDDYVNDEDIEE